VSAAFNGLMNMPSHLTTVRGRGGLGSANQKLMDVFFTMTSDVSSSSSIQALMHWYIGLATANTKTDAEMKVVYGFPLNTYSTIAGTDLDASIDGTVALASGMKLYLADGDAPPCDHMAFYVPRMVPFFKAVGKNEVEVMVNTAREVRCWSWGSYNGAAWASVIATGYLADFFPATTDPYHSLVQYRGLNLIVCKIGTTAGTTSSGDTAVIPSTQLAP
jgi:hypothetical protein